MKRATVCFKLDKEVDFKTKILKWATQQTADQKTTQPIFYYDSNHHNEKYSQFDALIGVGKLTETNLNISLSFEKLRKYYQQCDDWLLGYLSYDLKNELEDLHSNNKDFQQTPELYFFQPEKLIIIKGNSCELHYPYLLKDQAQLDFEAIKQQKIIIQHQVSDVNIRQAISRDDYLKSVNQVLQHIQQGDIYEMNFCQTFFAENVEIQPVEVFQKLNQIAESPFAAYCQFNEHHILSASPERYIQKSGNQVISQPIKGTAKRLQNKDLDKEIAIKLQNDPKERAENIMITDLVRNDLAKTAQKGSVNVDELCGLYSFKTVHQLVSTISSQVNKESDAIDLLKSTFPMGSMTGAPKLSAMQIIEKYEHSKRGIYSGAIGYFTPEGDFDFNVVIRSILYNARLQRISLQVGSAITSQSSPQKEYEECLLKAEALLQALQ